MADIFICLLVGFGIFIPIHILVWRHKPSSDPRIWFLTFFMGCGILVSAGLFITWYGFDANRLFLLVCLAMFLDMCYMYVYSAVCRAVSLTIMIRILEKGQPLLLDDVVAEYTASARFDERIRVMADLGVFSMANGTVSLTSRGAKAAKFMRMISELISGRLEG